MFVAFGSAGGFTIPPKIFTVNSPFYYAIKNRFGKVFFAGNMQEKFLSKF